MHALILRCPALRRGAQSNQLRKRDAVALTPTSTTVETTTHSNYPPEHRCGTISNNQPNRTRTTKEPPDAMTNIPNCVRSRSSTRSRTSPNKPERATDLKTAEETRKNLKKPESPKFAISSKTLAIVAAPRMFRPEKKSSRKPENRRSPSRSGLGNPHRPEPARSEPFRPQSGHSTAKTTPKLTKTDHPKRAISSKTLDFRPILPPAEKFAAKLSTQEAKL